MDTHEIIRDWIAEVLKAHLPLLAIAGRRRSKFEGWLKLELAAYAAGHGAEGILLEAGYCGGSLRSDVAFVLNGTVTYVELKTSNTNWRMSGVDERHRPITKNIDSIVQDAQKLRTCDGLGIVAFVLFPVPVGDSRWLTYLRRIAQSLGADLSEASHSVRVRVPLTNDGAYDAVVCAFPVRADTVARGTAVAPAVRAKT